MDNVASYSVADLEALLQQRKSALAELTQRRETLAQELAALDQEINSVGGVVKAKRGRKPGSVGVKKAGAKKGKTGKRGRNASSLHAVVVDLLSKSKKGLSLSDLQDKVLATGYQTTASNFRNVLYQCVYNAEDIFHDSEAGTYRTQAAEKSAE